MNSQALEQRRYRITGKVQGVFFRASTQHTARQLGLTGHAHNLADGSVEVLAVGTAPLLEQLAAWLHHGPPSARVDRVELLQQGMPDRVPNDFCTG